MQIEYIAQYFDRKSTVVNRSFSPAGVAKMDYYLSVLNELGYDTKIYSTCATNKLGYQKSSNTTNYLGQPIHYRSSFGGNSPKFKFLDLIFGRILLFFHLLLCRNCKNKIFIVYHERLYTPIVKFASKLRKLNVILDIEELYSVAANRSQKNVDKEIRSLNIKYVGYLFPTLRLRKVILRHLNINKNSFVVCSGNYQTFNTTSDEHRENTVVYAGTFEAAKGSATMAIKAAKYLPASFTMYICGFGTIKETADIKCRIKKHNSSAIGCKIVFLGSLLGDDYTSLLSKGSIGLAIQNPNHELNNTSFPSKILEYLRFGLKVVSSDVDVVKEDKCSDLITFFAPYTPESLAKAIMSANIQPNIDSKHVLDKFHEEFKNQLNFLINKLSSLYANN